MVQALDDLTPATHPAKSLTSLLAAKPKEQLSMVASEVPYLGDLKDGFEVVTGVDPITEEKIKPWERVLTGGAAALPLIGGAVARKSGKNLVEGVTDGFKFQGKMYKKYEDMIKAVKKAGYKPTDIETPQFNRWFENCGFNGQTHGGVSWYYIGS